LETPLSFKYFLMHKKKLRPGGKQLVLPASSPGYPFPGPPHSTGTLFLNSSASCWSMTHEIKSARGFMGVLSAILKRNTDTNKVRINKHDTCTKRRAEQSWEGEEMSISISSCRGIFNPCWVKYRLGKCTWYVTIHLRKGRKEYKYIHVYVFAYIKKQIMAWHGGTDL
jgi:hypothetical protein